MTSSLLVSARELKKTFFIGQISVPALSGVDLEIRKGEFVAVVGPSGSGKSTLLHLIGVLDVPTSGELVLLGNNVAQLSKSQRSRLRLRELGFVFQAYNLIPVLTAQENVEFVLELQGVDAKKRRQKSLEILDELGLADLRHRRPAEMSGGQQQRVAVARAVVSTPQLVLADEPTANLDGDNAEKLIDVMKHLRKDHGVTFLFSTHDKRVMDHAARVITLTDGRVTNDERFDGRLESPK